MATGTLRRAIALALLGGFASMAPAHADDAQAAERLRFLNERIEVLEAESEARRQAAAEEGPSLSWSALVEVEAGWAEDYAGESSSDLVLATVELGLEARINEWLGGRVLLLHEDGGSDLEVDEAVISLGWPGFEGGSLDIGRQYLPFGRFETALVSDPLALELGETRETAAMLAWEGESLYAMGWLFKGDTKEDIGNLGATVGFTQELDALSFDVGFGYTSSIGDSDTLQELVAEDDRVAGYNLYAVVTSGPFSVNAEYMTASDSFGPAFLEHNGAGAKPSAWGVEVSYGFDLMGREATVAAAVQGTREALALDLPEQRYLAGLSVGLMDNLSLAFEYSHDTDYDTEDGGSGESASAFVVQLAAEF
ncbi:MAG: LbtU family siderophore porin [Ectothiorhodospiraceae bacterium]|nr:LbtU family siderophore porin [Ectothiorhodospiraceae bacterium]